MTNFGEGKMEVRRYFVRGNFYAKLADGPGAGQVVHWPKWFVYDTGAPISVVNEFNIEALKGGMRGDPAGNLTAKPLAGGYVIAEDEVGSIFLGFALGLGVDGEERVCNRPIGVLEFKKSLLSGILGMDQLARTNAVGNYSPAGNVGYPLRNDPGAPNNGNFNYSPTGLADLLD